MEEITPAQAASAPIHAHRLVYVTACELTRVLYDHLMMDNALAKAWKAKHPDRSEKGLEDAFVASYWSGAIDTARATLARQLATSTEESLKETILEALILDNTLARGRRAQQDRSTKV